MADRNARVQDLIREQLQKNPDATTQELQAAARGVDASVGDLSLRQFNAGYVLPLKRRAGGGKRKAKPAAARGRRGRGQKQEAAAPARETTPARRSGRGATGGSDRDRVRDVLLQFARDLSEAESRSAIVGVVSDLDRYVDEILAARG
jgi:hypothetical protein